MQERAFKNPKINFLWNKEVSEVVGDGKKVIGAKLKDTTTGEISEFKCDGIFLAIGHVPNTSIFKGIITMDDIGYIQAENTKTNIQGVFAAGEVADKRYRQAITDAGTGCAAALEAERYLEEMNHEKME